MTLSHANQSRGTRKKFAERGTAFANRVESLLPVVYSTTGEAEMANRGNHYEAAFEAYLRASGMPYIAIDESRRSVLAGESLKSLDFIVNSGPRESWLVDVKGRRSPAGDEARQFWKNWSTRDDLRAMAAWERLFGVGFRGLLVFAYAITGDVSPLPADQLFTFRDRLYAFVGVRLADYASFARPISAAWQTVALPSRKFREIARPLDEILARDDSGSAPDSELASAPDAATIERSPTGSSSLPALA
jgi:hypothetical protein